MDKKGYISLCLFVVLSLPLALSSFALLFDNLVLIENSFEHEEKNGEEEDLMIDVGDFVLNCVSPQIILSFKNKTCFLFSIPTKTTTISVLTPPPEFL